MVLIEEEGGDGSPLLPTTQPGAAIPAAAMAEHASRGKQWCGPIIALVAIGMASWEIWAALQIAQGGKCGSLRKYVTSPFTCGGCKTSERSLAASRSPAQQELSFPHPARCLNCRRAPHRASPHCLTVSPPTHS